jgi:hypothetical protein
VINYLRDKICKRDLELKYKVALLQNFTKICRHDVKKSDEMATHLQEKLHDYDQIDF